MKSLVSLILLFSLSAFAKEGGNGGDVIVCRDASGEIKTVELLDYYEARQMRKLTVVEYPNLSDKELFTEVATKINSMEDLSMPFNLTESLELMTSVRTFLKTGEASAPGILFTEEILVDITDSEELFIPRGCNVEQIAIWQYPSFPEDPRFIIQADLLRRLSDRDVRGLVLHEMIYKTFYTRSFGNLLKDSYSARYLHEKLMSKQFAEFTFTDYFVFLQGHYWRQGGQAFIRKGKYYLEVFNTVGRGDAFETRIIGSDVRIALNLDGKIDRALTKKYGSVEVAPYLEMHLPNYNPGQLAIGDIEANFVNEIPHSLVIGFVPKIMEVRLNAFSGEGPKARWGFSYKGTDRKIKHVTIDAAPMPVAQILRKNLIVEFDDKLEVVIKLN